jgi:hypothetical protein
MRDMYGLEGVYGIDVSEFQQAHAYTRTHINTHTNTHSPTHIHTQN